MRSRRGASAEVLRLALDRRLRLIGTSALVLEYEDVLLRPEHLAAATLTEPQARDFLTDVVGLLHPTQRYWSYRPKLVDADDEAVLEAAINGLAAHIVTFNTRHFKVAAEFGITPVEPGRLLQVLA